MIMVKRDLLLIFVLFFCIAVFAAIYYRLIERKKEKTARLLGSFAAGAGVFAFVFLAVLSRSQHDVETQLVPFWSYRASLSVSYALDVLMQIIENIGIFVPIGFLVPFWFEKKANARNVVMFCFLLSLFAEVSQYVFSLGICETDDLINNTLGGAVGYGLYCSMTAAESKNGRLDVKNSHRFLCGLLPLFAVYEMLVLLFVLRKVIFNR